MSDITMTANGFSEQQLIECIPNLRRYAHKLRWKFGDAEDLVQHVLARALAKRDQFVDQGRDSLIHWLTSIMHSQNVNQHRQRSREWAVFVPWPDEQDANHDRWEGGPAPDNTESRVIVSDLAHAFAALNPGMQEALRLVVLDGLSYEEAAEKAGVPVGTIRSRLARGRVELERRFNG